MTSLNEQNSKNLDFHVHTTFSDGYFSPQDVIKAAIEKKVDDICITDHYSTLKPALEPFDLEEYYTSLNDLKINQSSELDIFIGLEVDVFSADDFLNLSEFPWDLILFEYVFSVPSWEKIFTQIIDFKKQFPDYNIGLAHTRFARVSDSKFNYVTDKILEYEIIIELNTHYQNYLDRWFAYLDDAFMYSLGSDAHNLYQIGNIEPALYFLKNKNIPLDRILTL
ncbi:MAG: PHP domain-containing protein [Candidatus Hermodarchaeota archaeon]